MIDKEKLKQVIEVYITEYMIRYKRDLDSYDEGVIYGLEKALNEIEKLEE